MSDTTREQVRDEAKLAAGAAKLAAKDALGLAKKSARDLMFSLAGETAAPTEPVSEPVSDPVIATGDQMSAALDRILTWAESLNDSAIPRTVGFAMREGQVAMEEWRLVRSGR